MGTLVFKTIHGSRLYGLAHADSDEDAFYVYNDRRRARAKKNGEHDIVYIGVDDLINKARSGSHQALEALFSPYKEWEDESYREFIENYQIPAADVREKYERTIKKLCYREFKYRRHAVRLFLFLFNLAREGGRTTPVLSPGEIEICNLYAQMFEGEVLWEVMMNPRNLPSSPS